jgi:hypothetical protein
MVFGASRAACGGFCGPLSLEALGGSKGGERASAAEVGEEVLSALGGEVIWGLALGAVSLGNCDVFGLLCLSSGGVVGSFLPGWVTSVFVASLGVGALWGGALCTGGSAMAFGAVWSGWGLLVSVLVCAARAKVRGVNMGRSKSALS